HEVSSLVRAVPPPRAGLIPPNVRYIAVVSATIRTWPRATERNLRQGREVGGGTVYPFPPAASSGSESWIECLGILRIREHRGGAGDRRGALLVVDPLLDVTGV